MKSTSTGTGRIVYDQAYYVGLLRRKISDVNNESVKLRTEMDQQSRDNTQYVQLEKRYESLVKSKEALEGQLADYNLALDKVGPWKLSWHVLSMIYLSLFLPCRPAPPQIRTTCCRWHDTCPRRTSSWDRTWIGSWRNARTGRLRLYRLCDYLSRLSHAMVLITELAVTAFFRCMQIEDQIEAQYRAIQQRVNELEPGKLRSYNELIARQRELQDRNMLSENRLGEINRQIHMYESDDKSNALRKEYLALEKTYNSLKKDADALNEELAIANLDPKEAHGKFVARVNEFKSGAKLLEEKANTLREETLSAKRTLEDLESVTEDDSAEMKKYELLVKRDQDMTAFIDSFDSSRASILQETQAVQYIIVAILEDMSKNMDDGTNMPSQEAHLEMEDARTFKEKNLLTAQKTMESLLAERRKREKELDLLRSSEPKLMSELSNLRESMSRMRSEMEQFQDLDRLRREFDSTQTKLLDFKQTYVKRRDTMRQQLTSVSVEYEGLKKALAGNEIAKEIDETEKRLKLNEKTIFDLREYVDSKTRETDYELVKLNCLKLTSALNAAIIKSTINSGSGGGYK